MGRIRLLLTSVLIAATTVACGSSGGAGDGKIKLTIGTFNDFGYKDLYQQYMKDHPNIEIVEQVSEYQAHHTQLATRLAARTGAPDVVAVEGEFLGQFTAQPQNFNDLTEFGAGNMEKDYLPWKWEQSKAGNVQIGLGTDVGSLAICYRRDLFEKAGLPSGREEVAKLWPTWNAFLDVGKRFQAANTGASFFDSGALLFNAVLGQANEAFYSPDNKMIAETNPAVKQAYDLTTQAVEAGLSAKIAAFSPQWSTGFKQGSFALVTCPAWVMAFIQSQAPDTKGQWDVAAVPNGGGGNWGGSWLTVPKQSKNPKEAYELAKWLTAPEQQLSIFKKIGNLPSRPALYDDPAMSGFTNPFFNDAPVGKMFGEAAKALKPQYQGPKTAAVRLAVQNGISRVEQGKESASDSWQKSLRDAVAAAG
ncbi:extracellular solute-binding protein [Lentzea sp. NPDC058450]|uniref:ABC transporter substrate-binding protein n=1 Tax=Lentzea sp. NPDC058450 TaxID=3346505 RepID=UPI00364C8FE6